MMVILIDTNALLRFLLNDVPAQTLKIKELFKRGKLGKVKIVIPEAIFFEVQFALKKYYKFPKVEIIDKLKLLLLQDLLEIESRDIFLKTLIYYLKSNLSFVDCFLVAKSESAKAKIFTFDENLKKFAKTAAS